MLNTQFSTRRPDVRHYIDSRFPRVDSCCSRSSHIYWHETKQRFTGAYWPAYVWNQSDFCSSQTNRVSAMMDFHRNAVTFYFDSTMMQVLNLTQGEDKLNCVWCSHPIVAARILLFVTINILKRSISPICNRICVLIFLLTLIPLSLHLHIPPNHTPISLSLHHVQCFINTNTDFAKCVQCCAGLVYVFTVFTGYYKKDVFFENCASTQKHNSILHTGVCQQWGKM